MTVGKKIFQAFFAALLLLAPASAARADYVYIHNEGEYSVTLPDAPVGETIWADRENIPYLDRPGKFGSLGEYATMRRMDPETGDFFDVHITFLKADPEDLLGMTEEKLFEHLKASFTNAKLEGMKTSYSAGSGTLKWATLTGFSVNEHNSLLYNAAHFLTGFETLLVIKVQYTAENKDYAQMYQTLAQSIKFTGK